MCIYIYTMMLIRKMFWLCWLWFGSLFCKALNDGPFFRIALKWNRQYLIEGSWKTQIMQYSHGLNSKAPPPPPPLGPSSSYSFEPPPPAVQLSSGPPPPPPPYLSPYTNNQIHQYSRACVTSSPPPFAMVPHPALANDCSWHQTVSWAGAPFLTIHNEFITLITTEQRLATALQSLQDLLFKADKK